MRSVVRLVVARAQYPFQNDVELRRVVFHPSLQPAAADQGGNRDGQTEPDIKLFGQAVKSALKELNCRILAEPGRFIVGPAGVLVSQVQYIKRSPFKNFAIIDTGMHHLLRPALYEAYHRILPIQQRAGTELYDIVGPICESSDVLGRARLISTLVDPYWARVGTTHERDKTPGC